MDVISFQTTFLATLQILLMGGVGYFLVKKGVLDASGSELLSGLLIKVFYPAMIFYKLSQHFSFQKYSDWWMFPLLSFLITAINLLVARGMLFFKQDGDGKHKNDFLALAGFQNGGWIPLLLVAALFTGESQSTLFVYIFLFIIGFDLTLWSLSVCLLASRKISEIRLRQVLNPPLLTTLFTLGLIAVGLHKLIPETLFLPVKMFGDCSMPLAMIVVGGNLAKTRMRDINKKDITLLVLAKLIIVPSVALLVISGLKVEFLLGFFILLETAVPSAVSLSVISRHFRGENSFINQGIFIGHIVSVVTIPLFLTLYIKLNNHF